MKRLYTPFKVNKLELKNRVIMSPMSIGHTVDGFIMDDVVEFYKRRAQGGVGLIIFANMQWDKLRYNPNHGAMLTDEKYIPSLKKLTDAIHEGGSKVFAQLMHRGRCANRASIQGEQAVAPSPIPGRFTHFEMPKELTVEEIKEFVDWQAEAAVIAKKAGFDGIEIETNSGYLYGQFFSPLTNHRTDEYGGSLENRCRFMVETLEGMRAAVGPDYPISLRVSGSDFMDGGCNGDDIAEICELLDKTGYVDGFSITAGWHESAVPLITMEVPHGAWAYLGRQIKARVKAPVAQGMRMNIMVNTNPRSTADEIIRRIKDCTPKMVITDSDGADAVVQALKDDKAGVEHMVFCPALEKGNRWDELGAWESIISDDASEPDISISPEDIAILQYTGGTTGVLKGCCQTNHAFVAKAMAQVQYFRPFLNDNDYENYMVIIALGMSHAFGFGQGIVVNLTMGGTIFFAESLDEILRVIEKYRPTVWPSVPLWMKLIATHEEYQKYDISSLKVITCGSAPLPVDVIRRVEELTGAVITEGYGMTETVNTITINGHDHRKVGTVGVVNPNIEYLIVDQETGTEVVEDGQPGEIICRGECVMHEYWNNPEETAKMLRNGWLYTGDIGRIDEEGFLIICDRKKDLIITGGFNVFPSELEAVAITAENVADAIAIGVPNERRGEVPAIFVQPIAGKTVDLNEVERVCREKLSRFKVPKEYYIMDMLPKTKNRKPDRKMVKKLYLEHAFDDQKKEQ